MTEDGGNARGGLQVGQGGLQGAVGSLVIPSLPRQSDPQHYGVFAGASNSQVISFLKARNLIRVCFLFSSLTTSVMVPAGGTHRASGRHFCRWKSFSIGTMFFALRTSILRIALPSNRRSPV